MTIQEINELTIEQVEPTLLQRLELEEGQEPTQEQLEAEFEAYKAELIAEEESRLAELVRIQDLRDRFDALPDKGLLQGAADINNPAAYFRDEILRNEDKAEAEQNMLALESAYSSAEAELDSDAWLRSREREYAKLDKMLLEALAEKEAGRPDRMEEYLTLREQIRLDHPKP